MEASTPSPSSPLTSLLSDPALLSAVRGIVSGLGNEKNTKGESGATPNAGGGIDPSALLSDPALLQTLPRLVSALTAATAKGATEAKESEESLPVSVPPSPPVRPAGSIPRNELLLSLKPFLSKERCEAIDLIIRLSTLGGILGKMI